MTPESAYVRWLSSDGVQENNHLATQVVGLHTGRVTSFKVMCGAKGCPAYEENSCRPVCCCCHCFNAIRTAKQQGFACKGTHPQWFPQSESIPGSLKESFAKLTTTAILDGEIVCLDAEGKSHFMPLLARRLGLMHRSTHSICCGLATKT